MGYSDNGMQSNENKMNFQEDPFAGIVEQNKTCKFCGKQIPSNAEICPYCNKKQKQDGKTIGGVIAGALCLGLCGTVLLHSIIFSPNRKQGEEQSVGGNTESSSSYAEDEEILEGEETNENSTERDDGEQIEEKTPVVDTTVIFEGNGVTITATGIEEEYDGYALNMLVENNSSLNLGINARAYAVNGIMTGESIYAMRCDVAAGKKANTAMTIKRTFLDEYGIEDVRYIDVLFWAYDTDAAFKEFDTGQIMINTSLDNGAKDVLAGDTLLEEDGIRVDFLFEENNVFYYGVFNDSGAYVDFDVADLSFNDYTSSDLDYDLMGVLLLDGCEAIIGIEADNDFLYDNDISEITSVEWNLTIRPEEDYAEEKKLGPIVISAQEEQ